MGVRPADRSTRVVILKLSSVELADELVYITPFASEAEEIVFIDTIGGEFVKKHIRVTPLRSMADKVVYVGNPAALKRVFCLSCGEVKTSTLWDYCGGSHCSGTKNKAMVEHLKMLLRHA